MLHKIIVISAKIDQLTKLWKLLPFNQNNLFSAGTEITVMMVVLGIVLFIDKRKDAIHK